MVKEKIGQRYCEGCGEVIWNRRADARKCLECRRKAEREASQKVKEIEKKERILRKVKITGIKFEIEEEKIKGILDNLKQGPKEDLNRASGVEFDNSFGTVKVEQEMKDLELKPFQDLIDEKVKQEKEKEEIKRNAEEKEKRKFLSFQ